MKVFTCLYRSWFGYIDCWECHDITKTWRAKDRDFQEMIFLDSSHTFDISWLRLLTLLFRVSNKKVGQTNESLVSLVSFNRAQTYLAVHNIIFDCPWHFSATGYIDTRESQAWHFENVESLALDKTSISILINTELFNCRDFQAYEKETLLPS